MRVEPGGNCRDECAVWSQISLERQIQASTHTARGCRSRTIRAAINIVDSALRGRRMQDSDLSATADAIWPGFVRHHEKKIRLLLIDQYPLGGGGVLAP